VALEVIERPIEREYRGIMSDNRRWERYVPRPGDILVCTPAKCGTTWMQAIVAELVFPDGLPGPVMELFPWLDARFEPIEKVIAQLDAQTHRRSVKTHTPADGIPWYPSVSYIVVGRDGRDAFMSFLNHSRNFRRELFPELVSSALQEGIELGVGAAPPLDDPHEFFTWCIDDNPLWFEHVASFWPHHGEPNVLFVHYNDMQADLDAEMRRVAGFLGIEVDERRWADQVERCTFAGMKGRSAEIGDFEDRFVEGINGFLYKGTNGRWRDLLTDEELERFERRAREFLPADAIAWTTFGRAGLGA
jgi:aryl sulfotransferase